MDGYLVIVINGSLGPGPGDSGLIFNHCNQYFVLYCVAARFKVSVGKSTCSPGHTKYCINNWHTLSSSEELTELRLALAALCALQGGLPATCTHFTQITPSFIRRYVQSCGVLWIFNLTSVFIRIIRNKRGRDRCEVKWSRLWQTYRLLGTRGFLKRDGKWVIDD